MPLNEVVQFFQDFSGCNVTLSRAVDGEATRVTAEGRDRLFGDVLREVLAQHRSAAR